MEAHFSGRIKRRRKTYDDVGGGGAAVAGDGAEAAAEYECDGTGTAISSFFGCITIGLIVDDDYWTVHTRDMSHLRLFPFNGQWNGDGKRNWKDSFLGLVHVV